jgi:hypothetical protein
VIISEPQNVILSVKKTVPVANTTSQRCTENEEKLHTFLELGIRSGHKWLASLTGLLICGGRALSTHFIEGYMVPQLIWIWLQKETSSL